MCSVSNENFLRTAYVGTVYIVVIGKCARHLTGDSRDGIFVCKIYADESLYAKEGKKSDRELSDIGHGSVGS